jgi:hypothetical protein
VYSIQHYVIKFVSDLRQVAGFSPDTNKMTATTGLWVSAGTLVSSTNKSDSHDITEILLKVALKHHNPYLPAGKSWYFRG